MADSVETLVVKIPDPHYTTFLAGDEAGNILHFGSLRVRVTGSGNLLMSIFSLDDVRTKVMQPFVLETTNHSMPVRIVNFNTQKARVKFSTQDLDDYFVITRIIIFVKKLFTMYPA